MNNKTKQALEQPAQQEPVQRYSPDGEGGMEIDSFGAWVKFTSPPAQRKPLTPEWINECLREASEIPDPGSDYAAFEWLVRKVEAAIKEQL